MQVDTDNANGTTEVRNVYMIQQSFMFHVILNNITSMFHSSLTMCLIINLK